MSLLLLQGCLPKPSYPSHISQGIQPTHPTLPTSSHRGDLSAVYTSSVHYNPMFGDEQPASALPLPGSPPRNLGQSHNPYAYAHASSNPLHASTSGLHEVKLSPQPTAAQKAHQQNRLLIPHNALDSAHASQGECTIHSFSYMLSPTFSKHPPWPFPPVSVCLCSLCPRAVEAVIAFLRPVCLHILQRIYRG